jgi:hypothetical protein
MVADRITRVQSSARAAARAVRAAARDPARVARVARALAVNPAVTVRALPSEWLQKRGQDVITDWDESWYQRLHELLGAPWPCPERDHAHDLLANINELLATHGLRAGRHTYGWYSDAESALCAAIWCTVRHARPEVVVETGVAHGVSTRLILEGLIRNNHGHLWSIDLPHPLDHTLHARTGIAVTDSCRARWTYIEGESRRQLPQLVQKVGNVHLFIHDSLHTSANTLFEMEQAASAMPAGGVMLVDDIKRHNGFSTFIEHHHEYRPLLCQAADRKNGFGVAAKLPALPGPRHQR